MVKKLRRYVKPFSSDTGTLQMDGQTDRRTDFYRASVCWRAIKTLWLCFFVHTYFGRLNNTLLSVIVT